MDFSLSHKAMRTLLRNLRALLEHRAAREQQLETDFRRDSTAAESGYQAELTATEGQWQAAQNNAEATRTSDSFKEAGRTGTGGKVCSASDRLTVDSSVVPGLVSEGGALAAVVGTRPDLADSRSSYQSNAETPVFSKVNPSSTATTM